ncbi:bifunctional lysylphosphatidylglycerol flippase/synthetase MprF [Algicella marina]|uniref:Phosphatidylglycerol lysyltransferase n=1 Tax=Algicella marina TaxID=2683284 RepID=A0A6P1SZ02_9RHOB|nr:phosphatidylglycerol lysyltransferase domain-containing protein [Algicella marina]QHQ34840.1 DUF2156 domain-containing protein [Algicella marina]
MSEVSIGRWLTNAQWSLTARRLPNFVRFLPRGLLLAAIAAFIYTALAEDLRELDWNAVRLAVEAVPSSYVLAALALTAMSYLAMARYDVVAVRTLALKIPEPTTWRAGFVATSLGQTMGFGVIIGSAVRWRFYRHEGYSAATAGMITAVVSAAFFFTLLMVTSASLLFGGTDFTEMTGLTDTNIKFLCAGVFSVGLLVFALSYLQPTLRIAGRRVALPRFQPLVRLTVLALLDVIPAAAALWILLPADVSPDFWHLLPIYAVALALALISNTPGGLGVLEFACLVAWPDVPAENIIAALILYRVIFYGIPFVFGLAFLADHETSVSVRPDRLRATRQMTVIDLLAESVRADANLYHQGDKQVFRSTCGTAAILYRDSGNARVALSDPFGEAAAWPRVIQEFLHGARSEMRMPAAYKLSAGAAQKFRRAGCRIHVTGQEAVVDPGTFSLDGSRMRELRRKVRQAEKAGVTVEFCPAGGAPFDELSHINAMWQAAKQAPVKGFSLGRFAPDYIENFPLVIARDEGRVIGFLSLWQSGDGKEWSIDLMQTGRGAPSGTMQQMIVFAINHAKEHGAYRFSLCSVQFANNQPPNSLAERIIAICWRQLSDRNGLKGLWRFKEMFRPEWEPLHLAVPHSGVPVTAALEIYRLVNDPAYDLPNTR